MSKCPECKTEQALDAQYCINCGFKLSAKPQIRTETNKKAYIGIVISVILIIVAISLVTSSEFVYYIERIVYYADQYTETKLHSSGFLGSSYASLASRWKDMCDEAIGYVVLHSVGAMALLIAGGMGLLKTIKN